jgi:hypothetical protein
MFDDNSKRRAFGVRRFITAFADREAISPFAATYRSRPWLA